MESRELVGVLALWDRGIRSAVRMPGGWNSSVWLVRAAYGARWVAKLAGPAFRSGLRVARRAGECGFRSGPPVPLPGGSLDVIVPGGSLDVVVPGGVLALLKYVEGRPVEPASAADSGGRVTLSPVLTRRSPPTSTTLTPA